RPGPGAGGLSTPPPGPPARPQPGTARWKRRYRPGRAWWWRFPPPSAASGFRLFFLLLYSCHLIGSLNRDQGDVVVLRMSAAEVLHPVDDRFHQESDALRAGLPQHGLELLLAKLVALVIQRFVNSIGVNHHGIQW